MSETSKDSPDEGLLEKHAAELSEHFDSVQIFATRLEPKSTRYWSHGEGNYFTRYGQVLDWMRRQDEQRKQEMRNDGETEG